MDNYEEYIRSSLENLDKKYVNKYETVKIIGNRVLEIVKNPNVEFYFDIDDEFDAVKIATREFELGYLSQK